MIIGIGTDIIEIKRIQEAIQRRDSFLQRIFTREEVHYCQNKQNKYQSFAVRFAAKEAAAKALGTGIRDFKWLDIEIKVNNLGKPSIVFKGRALKRSQDLGVENINLSLSHSKDYAIAMVVLEGGP